MRWLILVWLVSLMIAAANQLSEIEQQELYKAFSEGEKAEVQILLDTGLDIETDIFGMTPLAIAAFSNPEPEVLQLLIDRGANVNAVSPGFSDEMPLGLAVLNNSNVEIVRLLLEAGADVESSPDIASTPLMNAAAWNPHPQLTQMLIQAGAEVDRTNPNTDQTPLSLAAANNVPEVVRLLVEAGADIHQEGHFGNPVLFSALGQNCFDTVQELFVLGADPLKLSASGQTLLHQFAVTGHLRHERLARAGQFSGIYPTPCKDTLSIEEKFAYLLAHSGDVNALDSRGISPLMLTAVFNTNSGNTSNKLRDEENWQVRNRDKGAT